MLHVKLPHLSAQLMEQLVSPLLDAQGQFYKQVAFWELMETVDGYQPLEQLLLLVLSTRIALLLLEQQQPNVKLGDLLAYRMVPLASPDPLVHHIQLKLLAVIQEPMVHASGSPQQGQQQQELADSNYVQMLLQI